jgi:hypothetical protein
MSYRRRHRWLRRLALGLALVTALAGGRVSAAAAKADLGGSGHYVVAGGWSGPVDEQSGIPLSAGIGGELQASASPVRPDDQPGRFAHSSVAPQPGLAGDSGWTFERDEALMLVIGSTVLVLGLGLALGYLRRPKLAGL